MTVPYQCSVCKLVDFPTGFYAPDVPLPFDVRQRMLFTPEIIRACIASYPKLDQDDVCTNCFWYEASRLGLLPKTLDQLQAEHDAEWNAWETEMKAQGKLK